MTRSEARALGLSHYDEGRKPCPQSHVPVKRMVSNGQCVACCKEYAARVRATEPHRVAQAKETYRAKHPERVLQQARETYERRKEAANASHREWLAANPLKRREHEAKRRAIKKASLTEHYTTADVNRLLRQQRHCCVYCRTSIRKSFHVDHVVALSKGGDNSARNIQLLCQPCNQRKFTRHPVDFALSIGLLV